MCFFKQVITGKKYSEIPLTLPQTTCTCTSQNLVIDRMLVLKRFLNMGFKKPQLVIKNNQIFFQESIISFLSSFSQ